MAEEEITQVPNEPFWSKVQHASGLCMVIPSHSPPALTNPHVRIEAYVTQNKMSPSPQQI